MEIKKLTYNDLVIITIILPYKTNEESVLTIPAKGNVLIAPAMGITAQYYIPLGTWLCEQGFNIMILDYLGTGFSGSENIKNSTATLKDWVQNIEVAGRDLKESNPTLPLVFLGHSIGSQLFGFIEDTKLYDRAVFVASSTGYWKDGHSPQRWLNYLLLKVIIPLSNLIWGYTNAQFFKQGQNYPKYPSLQWRKWCLNKEYLKMELNDNQANNFNLYKGKISSLWFTDDSVANEITAPKLAAIYKNANINLIKLTPSDCNAAKIGHTGFLSRKFRDTLWKTILDNLI